MVECFIGGDILNYKPTQLTNSVTVKEIYTIHYFEYYRDYSFSGESHDFWEFLFIDKGEINATLCGELRLFKAGQAVLYKPEEFHSLQANGVSAPNTVVISFASDCEELYKLTGSVIEINSFMKIIIAEIIDEARSSFTSDLGDPCYTKLEMSPNVVYGSLQIIRIGIERMMINLIRGINKMRYFDRKVALNKQNDENEIMIRVKTYIDNNLSSDLNSDSVSAASGMSLSLLNKLFKKYTGKGIVGFIRQRRIQAACLMIRESDNNFTQIAEKLGFSSIHYFSRTFTQLMGMTPSQYANSVKAMIGPDKI